MDPQSVLDSCRSSLQDSSTMAPNHGMADNLSEVERRLTSFLPGVVEVQRLLHCQVDLIRNEHNLRIVCIMVRP